MGDSLIDQAWSLVRQISDLTPEEAADRIAKALREASNHAEFLNLQREVRSAKVEVEQLRAQLAARPKRDISQHIRLRQIAASSDALYGVDEDSNVWKLDQVNGGWERLTMSVVQKKVTFA